VRHAAGEDGALEAVGVHVRVELVAAELGEVLDVLQRDQVDVGDQRVADVQLLEVQAEGVLLGDVVLRALLVLLGDAR
jgi:hypothetical protein